MVRRTPVIPALRRLMQEGYHSGCEFKASLDYVKRPYLNAPNPKERERKALGGEREEELPAHRR